MTTAPAELTDARRIIYTKSRIIDALYRHDPEQFGGIETMDISSISIGGDTVKCVVSGSLVSLDRSTVISNFWQHRTRTPSYFDYRIWKSYTHPEYPGRLAIGAVSYDRSSVLPILEAQLKKGPQIAVDRDGVQKIYFVNEDLEQCSCASWQQLFSLKDELSKEFEDYSTLKASPVCKHVQWLRANIRLQSMIVVAKSRESGYNPRLCVYSFDSVHKNLRYRLTTDGVKSNGQWLPVAGWKEKPVYDASRTPTGHCWNTFEAALSQDQPYKLVPYSPAVAAVMSQTGRK